VALIHHLLLEEHRNMLLLHHEGELEVGNVKRQILIVEDAQHINLLADLLDASLQLTHTCLFLCMLLNHMLENLP